MKHAIPNTPYFFFLFEEEQEKQNAEGSDVREAQICSATSPGSRLSVNAHVLCMPGEDLLVPPEKTEDDIVKLLLREDAGGRVAGKTCPVELGRRVS